MSVSTDKAVIARIMRSGEKFEILVDPRKALEVKSGKDLPIEDFAVSQEVYKDVHKGMRIQATDLNKAFGTNDIKQIIYKIVRNGEVQLTTEQRHEIVEDKTKQIATMISKQGVNPQTNLPHPVDRVLRAMEQAKVKVQIDKDAKEQIESTLDMIQKIIPIKIEIAKLTIKVPPEFAGKAANIIRNMGKITREEWRNDGSYSCMIEVSAGMQQEIYDKLNSLTHGQTEIKKT